MTDQHDQAAGQPLFPTSPGEVKVSDLAHLLIIGEAVGVNEAIAELEKGKAVQAMPGVAYAIAVLKRIASEKRERMMVRNIRLAAKHGADLSTDMIAINIRGDGALVVWQPNVYPAED